MAIKVTALPILLLFLGAQDAAKTSPADVINGYFEARWKELKRKPAKPADGYVFYRRAALDITGRLPEPQDIRRWGRSRGPEKVVDDYLASDEAAVFFADMWIQWLNGHDVTFRDQQVCEFGALHAWLRDVYKKDVPYPDMIRALVADRGDPAKNPGANFPLKHLNSADPPAQLAAHTARLFLDRDIRCAQCHDHPYEKMTQENFWQFAAFFRPLRIEGRSLVERDVQPRGDVRNDLGELRLPPVYLDGRKLENGRPVGAQLADFLVSTAEHAEAVVERYWRHFFGRPLGKEHPELKKRLVEDFLRSGQGLPRLIRGIATSKPYRLSSEGKAEDRDLYLAGPLKYMNAVQFFKAFATVFELEKIYRERLEARRNDPQVAPLFRDEQNLWLGQYRWAKEMILPQGRDPEEDLASGTTRLAVKFLNSRDLQVLSFAQFGIIREIVKKHGSAEARVEALFLAILSRPPAPEEKSRFVEYVKGIENPYHGLEDVMWTLVNSGEFLFVR